MPPLQHSSLGDPQPSQSAHAGLTLPIMLKLLICFACFVVGALCEWMEAGPYALIAGLLAGDSGTYSTTAAWVGTFILVGSPAFWIFSTEPALKNNTKWKAMMMHRLMGALIVCTVGLGGFAWYQKSQPRTPRKVGSIHEAAVLARFIPTDVSIDAILHGVDFGSSYSIEQTKKGKVKSKEHYIPMPASEWPTTDLPVILHFEESLVGKHDTPKFTGEISVVKKPLPYLLRKAHVVPESARFGVFVNPNRGEDTYWLFVFLMSGIALVVICVIWLRSRKEWNTW